MAELPTPWAAGKFWKAGASIEKGGERKGSHRVYGQ